MKKQIFEISHTAEDDFIAREIEYALLSFYGLNVDFNVKEIADGRSTKETGNPR